MRPLSFRHALCPSILQVRPAMVSLVPVCYGEYSSTTESQAAFGPIVDSGTKPRFQFTGAGMDCPARLVLVFVCTCVRLMDVLIACPTADTNGEKSFTGQVNTYLGGGFRTSIPSKTANSTQAQAITVIRQLRDSKWIDRQTRAVFTDMALYNPAADSLSVVKMVCEFPPSGGALTRVYLRNIRAEQLWPRAAGAREIVLESFLLVLILGYVISELRLMYRMGLSAYFTRFWGIYDWLNFLLFFISYGFRYNALALAGTVVFPPESGVFVNYEPPAFYIVQWKNIMAINAFVTWIKIFKYLESVPFMTHLLKVFYTAIPDTIGFLVALIAVFVGATAALLPIVHFLV